MLVSGVKRDKYVAVVLGMRLTDRASLLHSHARCSVSSREHVGLVPIDLQHCKFPADISARIYSDAAWSK